MELRHRTTRRHLRRSGLARLGHVVLVWVVPILLVVLLSFVVTARG
jgi:hypothetical protein